MTSNTVQTLAGSTLVRKVCRDGDKSAHQWPASRIAFIVGEQATKNPGNGEEIIRKQQVTLPQTEPPRGYAHLYDHKFPQSPSEHQTPGKKGKVSLRLQAPYFERIHLPLEIIQHALLQHYRAACSFEQRRAQPATFSRYKYAVHPQ